MTARIFNQKYKILVLGSIVLLGFLIYSNTFQSSFHLDDTSSIRDNLAIRNISNLQAIWNFWPTRFITYLSVALNYHLSQLNVSSYHIFNLAVHLISGILVCWFMLLTFSTPAMKSQKISKHAKLIAFFAALIFITHPIQTQGVTYIIQRAASLTTLFYLLALSLYVKFRLLRQQGKSLVSSRLFYGGAFIAAVMAMFTKEMAITLPFMLLLYEICFLKTREAISWKYLFPFFITILIIPLTMFLTRSVDFAGMRRLAEPSTNISSWQYLLTQFRVIVTYIRLLFIPINQNLDYYYPVAESLLNPPILASLIFLVSLLAIAIKIFSKYRLVAFSIFWFFLTLLPESSIIPIRDVIFEHRLYLPMVGFSLFFVSLIYYLLENKSLKPMVIVLLVIISGYSILTYRRNFAWKDEFTLWNDVVHKSPNKARAYNSRGNAYTDQGKINEALADFNKAIEINPNVALVYYNRGNAYFEQGSFPQAISDYNKAIELNSDYAEAYCNRGIIYSHQGDFPQAISNLTKAIEINSNYAKAYYTRGYSFMEQKDIQPAVSDFTKAIELNPNDAEARKSRGDAYCRQGNYARAIPDYDRAVEIEPNLSEAYNNLAVIYYLTKEYDKAWQNVHKVEALGGPLSPEFLAKLKKASGREQ